MRACSRRGRRRADARPPGRPPRRPRSHVVAVDARRRHAERCGARAGPRPAVTLVGAGEGGDAVVLAHEQHRQPVERGPVEPLEERPAVDRAVAEEAGDDRVGFPAQLQRLRRADGDRDAAGHDAVGAQHADGEIGDVHGAALAAAVAARAAEELRHHRAGSAPLAMAWPCPRWFDVSRSSLRRLMQTPGGDRLLADRDMQRPRDLARAVRLERGLLEGPDAHHRAIEIDQTLQIVAGIAHLRLGGFGAACAGGGRHGQVCPPFRRAAYPPTSLPVPLEIVTDSVTHLGPDAHGRAVLAASHGGSLRRYLPRARASVKAVILCDAGVGRDRAGIGGLGYLDELGIAAAAVGHRSARIGDGADCAARGVISYVNASALRMVLAGVAPVRQALALLAAADLAPSREPPPLQETRRAIEASAPSSRAICAIDSASLVRPDDAGAIVLTGSHGGLLGRTPGDCDQGQRVRGRLQRRRFRRRRRRHFAPARARRARHRGRDGERLERPHRRRALDLSRRLRQRGQRHRKSFGAEIGISAVELVGRFAAAREGPPP